MTISGLDQLADLERRLRELADVPRRAAELAAPALLKVAQAGYASSESPEGEAWDPLKQKGGQPISELTGGVTAAASGSSVVITTPEPTKYHQGGFYVHTGAAGDRLREAQEGARKAKREADAEGLKRHRTRVREIKKQIRAEATHVVARRTLPRRKALPVSWGRALAEAWERACAEKLEGAAS